MLDFHNDVLCPKCYRNFAIGDGVWLRVISLPYNDSEYGLRPEHVICPREEMVPEKLIVSKPELVASYP